MRTRATTEIQGRASRRLIDQPTQRPLVPLEQEETMHPLFASAALALVAAWPISGLGWALGKTAERLTGDPEPRARLEPGHRPPAALALMVGVSALPRRPPPRSIRRPDLQGCRHRRRGRERGLRARAVGLRRRRGPGRGA
ncbi:hypothetical protein ACRAWD_01975 [Caulobacter segnis]